ncbi:MAG: nucleoside triphosphate pyrophosphatase [Bacteroidota bacterium]|nr:nucleoside triphosphate pyrophosphatase [Bacteroidota bacterium]
MKVKKKIILASASPRRQTLLRQIGFDFEVRHSSVEEVFEKTKTPEENVIRLAEAKALDIAKDIEHAFIVGADTIVVLNGEMMGKPADDGDAFRMLKKLSGREHKVFTGFAIVDKPSNKIVSNVEITTVKFRDLEDEEILEYVNSKSPADKAGAYGIQDDYGAVFVERINGCFYNVVGFPLTKFYITLQKFQKKIA